jgi:hypothetical protein
LLRNIERGRHSRLRIQVRLPLGIRLGLILRIRGELTFVRAQGKAIGGCFELCGSGGQAEDSRGHILHLRIYIDNVFVFRCYHFDDWNTQNSIRYASRES